jgi:PilZ domain
MSASPTADVAPRIQASEIPSITGLRLSPHGAEAKLVNISTSGLLAECALRLKVGSTVSVQFEGTFSSAAVPGRIARCEVSTMKSGMLMYHIGIDFNAPIDLGDAQPAQAAEAKRPAASVEPMRPRAVGPVPVAPAPAAPVIRNRW